MMSSALLPGKRTEDRIKLDPKLYVHVLESPVMTVRVDVKKSPDLCAEISLRAGEAHEFASLGQ